MQVSDLEKCFAIFALLVGAISFAYMLGDIGVLLGTIGWLCAMVARYAQLVLRGTIGSLWALVALHAQVAYAHVRRMCANIRREKPLSRPKPPDQSQRSCCAVMCFKFLVCALFAFILIDLIVFCIAVFFCFVGIALVVREACAHRQRVVFNAGGRR